LALAQYPLDKFRRVDLSAGFLRVSEGFANTGAGDLAALQAAQLGVPIFFNNGSIFPITASLVGETTRFREFGPLSGHTFSLSLTVAPGIGNSLSRRTMEGDVRKYIRLGGSAVFATRLRGFFSTGTHPDYFFFGGNMELRGYPYLSIVGNQGFFANAELRLPLIDLMKTPIGILGPVRGTLYAGIGGAHFKGNSYTFGTSQPGISYVACAALPATASCFGDPVSGYHLIDGRASYGFGLQFFFLGYPLHFDWSKLTDLKITSPARFDFWVGFDF
jgi:outer membrane protein assembly factor BamA